MRFINTILLFIFVIHCLCDKSDIGLNPGEIVANHGYPSETHQITTDDGYIITLYRIPHGINDSSAIQRPPVLLMHGFLSCSAQYIVTGPEKALGFIMADAGYDVWLPNARGTPPSRNHTTIDINTNPEAFFDFTWHEIGYYDIANSIDYILNINGDESLYYVGHSQGTTNFLVLTTVRPEYNAKIRMASLMAPAALIKHSPNSLAQMAVVFVNEIWQLLQSLQIYEVPLVDKIRKVGTTKCKDFPDNYTDPICDFLNKSLVKIGEKGFLPIVLTNCPANAGLKQYVHYGQLLRDGGFRQYDYGKEKNLEIYGSEVPPDYDLSKITVPVAFYYAENDGLIAVEDEHELANALPNVVINYLVPDANFSHNDFGISDTAAELVYAKLLEEMSQH